MARSARSRSPGGSRTANLIALPGGRAAPPHVAVPRASERQPRRIFLRKVQPLLGGPGDPVQAELSFHEREDGGRERLRLRILVDLDRNTPMGDLRESSLRAALELIHRALGWP
ncbi:MAG: hypothetical protein HY900_28470 [Deltaproteobacteria bacterium]|nr:hypothetical protein [Deltaproteobacteria bacterium]